MMQENFGNFETIEPIGEEEKENRCGECGLIYPDHALDCSHFHEEIKEEKLPEAQIVIPEREKKPTKEKEILISKEIKSMLNSIKFEIGKLAAGYNIENLKDLNKEDRDKLINYAKEIIDEESKVCLNCDWHDMAYALKEYENENELVGLTKEIYVEAVKRKYPKILN